MIISEDQNSTIVEWSENYATGIELIDKQHRELVSLTNELYRACTTGDEEIGAVFKEAMGRMVEYVRFHFSAELELLHRINFPEYPEHKRQHESLVKDILEAAKGYNEGRYLVPNNFVRTLKEWVFGHIAITDQIYALYVAEQKKKGLLSDRQIEGQ